MRVTSVQLQNFRSFIDTGPVSLGTVTLLVGRNNAGKSSLIRAMLWMQQFQHWPPIQDAVRVGADVATVAMQLEDVMGVTGWPAAGARSAELTLTLRRADGTPTLTLQTPEERAGVPQLPGVEPDHFVVPFLGQRKVTAYQEDVRREYAFQVGPNLQHLAAKLTRIVDTDFSGYEEYADASRELLGYVVRPVASQNGQRPGVYMDNTQTQAIYIDSMGDGVPHVVGLLADLVLSRGKFFVIEELETDLHPQALKVLLRLIAARAKENQFLISTHSNIVLRHLGALADSKVYYVSADTSQRTPVAEIRAVEPNPADRIAVLRELGYELYDFDLWDGWIILEESSAERLIRDHLIPWFAPGLVQRVRTLAAGGNAGVEPTFDDFHRLVRFTHLEDAYRDRAWVLIDGDAEGERIVARLREKYPHWSSTRFDTFSEPAFEGYYPERFADRRTTTLGLRDKKERREAKRELLESVRVWIREDPDTARREFEQSAAEVISRLRGIEAVVTA